MPDACMIRDFRAARSSTKMVVFATADQICRFARALPGQFPLLKELVRRRHAARDVGGRQQPAILCVFGQSRDASSLNCSCVIRVQSSIHIFAQLLFDLGILRRGLQNTCACHEDMVVLLMPDSIGLQCLAGRAVDVSSVQMEIS